MRPGGTVRTTLRGGGRPRPAVSHRRRRPLRLLFLSPFPVEETLPRFPCTALRWRPAEGSPSSPVVTSWATSPPCPQTLLRDQQPSLRLRLVLFGSLPVFCGFHAGGKSDGVCVSRVCVSPPRPAGLAQRRACPCRPERPRFVFSGDRAASAVYTQHVAPHLLAGLGLLPRLPAVNDAAGNPLRPASL